MNHSKDKSRYALQGQELSALPKCPISSLRKGDVFLRQGTPCMRVDPPVWVTQQNSIDNPNHIWIVNLTSGGCWSIPNDEQVWPAIDVNLTYATSRGGLT